jgi:hypothetical protein
MHVSLLDQRYFQGTRVSSGPPLACRKAVWQLGGPSVPPPGPCWVAADICGCLLSLSGGVLCAQPRVWLEGGPKRSLPPGGAGVKNLQLRLIGIAHLCPFAAAIARTPAA